MSSTEVDSLERILDAATLLFAEKGYHGVSTRAIAGAVGLNISTVNYHAGNKRELYRKVFHRLFSREYGLISSLIGEIDDATVSDRDRLRALLRRLVDGLVDMTVASPEVPRLWVRRWLEREFRFDEIEVDFSLPLYALVTDLLDRARRAGTIQAANLDTRLFVISFTWMLYGYFTGGPIPYNIARADPCDPDQVQDFKAFLHGYVEALLGL